MIDAYIGASETFIHSKHLEINPQLVRYSLLTLRLTFSFYFSRHSGHHLREVQGLGLQSEVLQQTTTYG